MNILNTQTIANTFIMLGAEENISISPMKLQKLTYFFFKDYLKTTGHALFTEPFEKWTYGPVLPSLYYEFNSFGAGRITRFAKDALGKVEIINLNVNSKITESFLKIWKKYRGVDAITLSSLTHKSGSAWDKAKTIISTEDIANEEE